MKALFVVLTGCLTATVVVAEIVVPSRVIRPQEILTSADLVNEARSAPGAVQHADDIVGMEARVTLYPGRPIFARDILQPALVDRNQLVTLVFRQGGLVIETEGRALGRGAAGDRIRVQNLSSRSTVSAQIRSDGILEVSQ